MVYSEEVNNKILTFFSRAQTRISNNATENAIYYYEGDEDFDKYISNIDESQELSDAIYAIDNDYNNWSESLIIKVIDYYETEYKLQNIPYVDRAEYNLNITVTGSSAGSGSGSVITGAATTIVDDNLTPNRAVISNASGKVFVSSVTSTEISYLDGVTSNIQAQLNAKAGALTTGDLTELTSSVLSLSGNTGAIIGSGLTIQVVQAESGIDGYLSGNDWNTFNNKLTSTLTNGYIFVGNGSDEATGVAVSGDVSLANDGTVSISSDVIVDSDINSNAAISLSKLDTLTVDRALISDSSGVVSPSPVSSIELGYVSGVTSSIQDQIDDKLDVSLSSTTLGDVLYYDGTNWVNLGIGTAEQILQVSGAGIPEWSDENSPEGVPEGGTANQFLEKIDGTDYNTQWATLTLSKVTDVTATASELNVLDGATATTSEINFLDGVTSSIQTQLDAKQDDITGAATSIVLSDLIANRALISNASGKVGVSSITSTELNYLNGVTSGIQTQIETLLVGSATSPTLQSPSALEDDYIISWDNANSRFDLIENVGISSLSEDITPQLGGNLDVNGNNITSTSNGDINIIPNGAGNVVLGNYTLDADQSVGVGQDDYVLTYNNSTGLIGLESSPLLDEDDFASNSATQPPSQQSAKAFIEAITGLLANLDTTDKTDLVAAINEVRSGITPTLGNSTPYADTNSMILDQGNQVAGLIYKVDADGVGGFEYYEYLGTTDGDLGDYDDVTSTITDIENLLRKSDNEDYENLSDTSSQYGLAFLNRLGGVYRGLYIKWNEVLRRMSFDGGSAFFRSGTEVGDGNFGIQVIESARRGWRLFDQQGDIFSVGVDDDGERKIFTSVPFKRQRGVAAVNDYFIAEQVEDSSNLTLITVAIPNDTVLSINISDVMCLNESKNFIQGRAKYTFKNDSGTITDVSNADFEEQYSTIKATDGYVTSSDTRFKAVVSGTDIVISFDNKEAQNVTIRADIETMLANIPIT